MFFTRNRAVPYITRLIEQFEYGNGMIHQKRKIEDALEYMYIQGALSKKKHQKLSELWQNKYTELANIYSKELEKKFEEEYQRKLKAFNMDE